jgi:hypothetical protein
MWASFGCRGIVDTLPCSSIKYSDAFVSLISAPSPKWRAPSRVVNHVVNQSSIVDAIRLRKDRSILRPMMQRELAFCLGSSWSTSIPKRATDQPGILASFNIETSRPPHSEPLQAAGMYYLPLSGTLKVLAIRTGFERSPRDFSISYS